MSNSSSINRTHRCEGYWQDFGAPKSYPKPKPNKKPFPGQKEWLKKLKVIEQVASNPKNRHSLVELSTRGLAPSRLEDGVLLGNKEFSDIAEGNCWTEDLGNYYINKFNVRPSKKFGNYVNAKYEKIVRAAGRKRVNVQEPFQAAGRQRSNVQRTCPKCGKIKTF